VWPIASMMSLRKSMGRNDRLECEGANVEERAPGRNGASRAIGITQTRFRAFAVPYSSKQAIISADQAIHLRY
jgi:hypothetical protein